MIGELIYRFRCQYYKLRGHLINHKPKLPPLFHRDYGLLNILSVFFIFPYFAVWMMVVPLGTLINIVADALGIRERI